MGRIRTIKPEFWQDEDIGELPMMARLAFIGAWNLADDEGLLKWTPAYIKAQLFAYDDVTQEDVRNILGTLEERSLVFPYKDGKGKAYAWIINFRKHQRIDKPQAPRNPVPSLQNPSVREAYARRDGWHCQICGDEIEPTTNSHKHKLSLDHCKPKSLGGMDVPSNIRATHFGCNAAKRDKYEDSESDEDHSKNVPGTIQEPSSLDQGSGSKEQVTGKGNTTAASAANDYPADFERAWQKYPKRDGGNPKRRAWKAWKARAEAGADVADLESGVERYAKHLRAKGKEGTQYVMQAATFFGPDEHWSQAWEVPASSAVKSLRDYMTDENGEEPRWLRAAQ